MGLEVAQPGLVSMVGVEVEHPYAAAGAGGDADVEVLVSPPCGDGRFVDRRQPQIVFERRLFATDAAGKDAQASRRQFERVNAERRHAAFSDANAFGAKATTAATTRCENAARTSDRSNSRTGEYTIRPSSPVTTLPSLIHAFAGSCA
jgi:hypothetical protein